jgi:hypothetical protein
MKHTIDLVVIGIVMPIRGHCYPKHKIKIENKDMMGICIPSIIN